MNGSRRVGRLGLSPVQEAVVADERRRLLVAAGAGSGKTSLLVAYFIKALVEDGLGPEEVAAVTFTRKAAAELVRRLREVLQGSGRSDLARGLDAAPVGTIHGLCRRLLKEDALLAGVDPAFSVIEAESAALLKEEACGEIWDQAVEQCGERELEVIASRGGSLRRQVVPIYDRLRGLGLERPRLEIQAAGSSDTRGRLAAAVRAALAAAEAVQRPTKTLGADLERLRACLAETERDDRSGEDVGPALRADLDQWASFFPSRSTKAMAVHFEPVREALSSHRAHLATSELRTLVDVMNDLLDRFHLRYEGQKRARKVLDFADLELRARALVAEKGRDEGADPLGIGPGSRLRLLVDEFQDTNELQCTILEGLGADRMLMVGDDRQSIYRFRGADVEVFRERETALAAPAAAPEGGVHHLDVNYRSRPEILAFVNRLFQHETMFGDRFTVLLPYRESSGNPGAVEVLVADRSCADSGEGSAVSIQEAEAAVLADRVRHLLDDEGWSQRDIVVLTPAQTHVDVYQRALVAHGVDVYVVRGRGYYTQDEVTDIAALLRLLVNPHDDLALITVLRSPLVGLSDDALFMIGRQARATRAGSLWRAIGRGDVELEPEDAEALSAFLARLEALRSRVGRPGLAGLIDDALWECGYDLSLLASDQGRRRFANVRKLMRMADDFEALEGPDVAGFVRVVQTMGELNEREGSAPILAEGEDVVRVMTVHQAKGLEFPVAVLAGLGSDVPRTTFGEFVVGDDGEAGVFLKGSKHGTYESNDLCLGPADAIVEAHRERERQEDVRLLYVAMTRAKERLLLVGARPRGERMDGCRIGRIVSALDLSTLPSPGETVVLDESGAVVVGATAEASAHAATATHLGGVGVAAPSAPTGPDGLAAMGEDRPVFVDFDPRVPTIGRLSFSALTSYRHCPRRFYLERVLGVHLSPRSRGGCDDDPPPTPGEEGLLDDAESLSGRDVGLVVHSILERCGSDDSPPEPVRMTELVAEVSDDLGLSLSAAGAERSAGLVAAYWRTPVAAEAWSAGALREAPFLFTRGDVQIAGVMDVVWCEGDRWRLIDHKTNALGGKAPGELASEYALQAAIYSLAAFEAGARSVVMDFAFLERPEEPVTIERDAADRFRLESLVDEALAGVLRGEYPRREGEQCAWCEVREVCIKMARS